MTSESVGVVEYRRLDNYVYRLTVGEHLLVSLHARKDQPLYALTPTGAQLWERLADWATVQQLTDALVAEYEVSADDAKQDVYDFISQLESLKAIETRGASE
jgi:hypothetical protein